MDYLLSFSRTLMNVPELNNLSSDSQIKDVQRIKFIAELLLNSTDFKELNKKIKLPKNNLKSEKLRKQGNDFFLNKNRDFLKALEFYNKSLCYAEKNSENLGISYANRSSVYFEWKKYDKCLENIKLARINNYPEKLKEKLVKRELKCKVLIKTQKVMQEIDYPKLSYPAHNNIPFIIDCLELGEDKQFGRFIKTNRDLNPGDFVSIEDPFCVVSTSSFIYKQCSYCLEQNFYSLIPCESCTAIMFCNNDCYQKALKEFHSLGCTIIDEFNPGFFCSLKSVLLLFADTDNLSKLKQIIDEIDEKQVNVFTIDHTKSSLLEKYKPIYTQITNRNKRPALDLLYNFTMSAFMYILSLQNPIMSKILQTKEYETLFLELIFRHIQIQKLCIAVNKNTIVAEYGGGFYSFYGLLNHSCRPNISRVCFSKKVAAYVTKPIKKGEQLFDNYGYTIYSHTKEERFSQMSSGYFRCQCLYCKSDIPFRLEINEKVPIIVPMFTTENDAKYDNIYEKKNIKKYCNFLSKYENYYPCVQLYFVWRAIIECFNRNYTTLL